MDSYLSNIDTYMEEEQQQQQWRPPPQVSPPKQQLYEQQHYYQQQSIQQHEKQPQHLSHQFQPAWSATPPPQPQYAFVHQNPYMPDGQPSMIPQSIHASNTPSHPMPQHHPHLSVPQQEQHPYLDEYGQPIKIRKKPGRKPNPASPALRKAQNRAAQRAFRERKERHLHDLEDTIRTLRDQRNKAIRELGQQKKAAHVSAAENWYLKGLVLTLQFICMHNNIQIPTHSPYLSEEDLDEMAKTTPGAVEAYIDSYTRNDASRKPTVANPFSNFSEVSPSSSREQSPAEAAKSEIGDQNVPFFGAESTEIKMQKVNEETEKLSDQDDLETEKEEDDTPLLSGMAAIQRIRLQLRVQSDLVYISSSRRGLRPTTLQLAVPHDPRIDLIPTPHMRDRMILFRDIMDYDRCFELLLAGSVYHGGDPALSDSWELPPVAESTPRPRPLHTMDPYPSLVLDPSSPENSDFQYEASTSSQGAQ
ncbi:hypothetical protein DFQ28_008127 [Apophysomyces sp. BC1034]|nr:hypothetical protein DFQ28_008127 [Apophysomyces sp. BC1034]